MLRYKILGFLISLVILAGIGYLVKTTILDVRPALLTVVGEGKAKATPEIAQFSISYITYGTSATEALEAEKVFRERVLTLLSGLYGVEQKDMQVSFPQVVSSNADNNLSYQAVNKIDVSFNKLSSLDTLVNKLYQTGGSSITISNIIFTTTNARNLEDQAITEAIKDGQMRAEKMARETGKKLGKLISVTGQQTQAVGTVTTEAKKSSSAEGSSAETTPGQIEILRTVTLVYELR